MNRSQKRRPRHQILERRIIRRLVISALGKGYTVSLWDGEEWTVKRANRLGEVMRAVQSTDADMIQFWNPCKGTPVGNVYLVYGNSGYDVIADYTDNPEMEETLLTPALNYADELEERERGAEATAAAETACPLPSVVDLIAALYRLELAAFARENRAGDPCGLSAAKAELSDAADYARGLCDRVLSTLPPDIAADIAAKGGKL